MHINILSKEAEIASSRDQSLLIFILTIFDCWTADKAEFFFSFFPSL